MRPFIIDPSNPTQLASSVKAAAKPSASRLFQASRSSRYAVNTRSRSSDSWLPLNSVRTEFERLAQHQCHPSLVPLLLRRSFSFGGKRLTGFRQRIEKLQAISVETPPDSDDDASGAIGAAIGDGSRIAACAKSRCGGSSSGRKLRCYNWIMKIDPCSLASLTDEQLLLNVKALAARERESTAQLIASLVELDRTETVPRRGIPVAVRLLHAGASPV